MVVFFIVAGLPCRERSGNKGLERLVQGHDLPTRHGGCEGALGPLGARDGIRFAFDIRAHTGSGEALPVRFACTLDHSPALPIRRCSFSRPSPMYSCASGYCNAAGPVCLRPRSPTAAQSASPTR